MEKFLYETTRRRRVYKLYIDWINENRRLVVSNINQFRADEARAKKIALDERLYLRYQIRALKKELISLLSVLSDIANENLDTLIPSTVPENLRLIAPLLSRE